MKILAIDTSTTICSIALLEDDKVIAQKYSDTEHEHSQTLMPMIKELFEESKTTIDDVKLLACCRGPRIIYRC